MVEGVSGLHDALLNSALALRARIHEIGNALIVAVIRVRGADEHGGLRAGAQVAEGFSSRLSRTCKGSDVLLGS